MNLIYFRCIPKGFCFGARPIDEYLEKKGQIYVYLYVCLVSSLRDSNLQVIIEIS